MIVKICGVRTAEVAEAAVGAGADWIGLVLVPSSPRYCDHDAALAVGRAVGGAADLVGVLVSPTNAGECDRVAELYGLDAFQVHGDVDRSFAHECSVPVIRALNPRTLNEALTLDWWPDGILHLDADPGDRTRLPGGTGRRVPVEWAVEVSRHRRIVLAGGLNAGNVASTIEVVRPFGVDASSGLETVPGVKDPARVREFVTAARAAERAAFSVAS